MDVIKEKLQENLKLIRQTLELSVVDVSELLGVSKQTIYNIEQGKSTLSEEQKEVIIEHIKERCVENTGLADIIKAIIS